jgi:flagellar basal body-associated protein FliL
MDWKIVMVIGLLFVVLVIGVLAVGAYWMYSSQNDQANAQYQVNMQAQCSNQYASCANGCDSYWLGSEKESCKANCNAQYNSCLR